MGGLSVRHGSLGFRPRDIVRVRLAVQPRFRQIGRREEHPDTRTAWQSDQDPLPEG